MANVEAPFIREIRLALDSWLDAMIVDDKILKTERTCKQIYISLLVFFIFIF